jgi:hypothetical protein
MEARCAPNRIDKLFKKGPSGIAPTWAGTGERKGAFLEAASAVSSCWRTNLEKVRKPKSLAEFEHVWSALWNTLGQAIEIVRDEQSGEVTSPAPTTKGCGIPSIIAPGQNERVMLCFMVRT